MEINHLTRFQRAKDSLADGRCLRPAGLGLVTLTVCMLVSACERNPEDNLLLSPAPVNPETTADTRSPAPHVAPAPPGGVEAPTPGVSAPATDIGQGKLLGVTMDEMMSHHGPGFIRGFAATPYPPRPDPQTANALIAADSAPEQGETLLSAPSKARMDASKGSGWSMVE